jgi:hypothetical protein
MEDTKAPNASSSEEWAEIPWRKLEHYLYRLQKRIAESLPTWRSEDSTYAPKTADEIPVCPTLSRPTSDPGQPGQENRQH